MVSTAVPAGQTLGFSTGQLSLIRGLYTACENTTTRVQQPLSCYLIINVAVAFKTLQTNVRMQTSIDIEKVYILRRIMSSV